MNQRFPKPKQIQRIEPNPVLRLIIEERLCKGHIHVASLIKMGMLGIGDRTMHTRERTSIGEFDHQVAAREFYLTDHISNVASQPAFASNGTVRACLIQPKSPNEWLCGKTTVLRAR